MAGKDVTFVQVRAETNIEKHGTSGVKSRTQSFARKHLPSGREKIVIRETCDTRVLGVH